MPENTNHKNYLGQEWLNLKNKYNQLSQEKQNEFTRAYLPGLIEDILGIVDEDIPYILRDSIPIYGIEEEENPCLFFISVLKSNKININEDKNKNILKKILEEFLYKKPTKNQLIVKLNDFINDSEKTQTTFDIQNSQITDDLLDAFDEEITFEDKTNFLKKNVLPKGKFATLSGIHNILIESILEEGLDPRRNLFLNFVLQLSFGMENAKDYGNKMRYIYNSYLNKKLDLDLEVLKNESLYNRSDKEFQYTLNVFNLLSNSSTASNYLKNTDVINLDELMDGNIIKPAGLDRKPGDTIYNKIEAWAQDNEVDAKDLKDKNAKKENKLSVSSILNTNSTQSFRYCNSILKRYIKAANITTPLKELQLFLFTAFTLPEFEKSLPKIEARALMLPEVTECSVPSIKGSSNSFKELPEITPASLLSLENIPGTPNVIYLFDKILLVTLDNKFVADAQVSQSINLRNDLLNSDITVTNKKDREEVEIEIVKAFEKIYKNSETKQILFNIWKTIYPKLKANK